MLRVCIAIDLPSAETDRRLRPVEWVRALFGAPIDARSGHEELTVSAWSLLQGLRSGFEAAGVTDAVSLLVDGQVIYADDAAVPDDLDLLVHVARRSGVLERTFRELRLVLDARHAGLHVLFEVTIHREVLLGEAELAIEVSARPDLAPGVPPEIVARLARRDALEALRLSFDAFVADLTAELARLLDGAAVSAGPSRIELVRPPPAADDRPAQWRPVPAARHDPADDPFPLYLDDPAWARAAGALCDAVAALPDEDRHPLLRLVSETAE